MIRRSVSEMNRFTYVSVAAAWLLGGAMAVQAETVSSNLLEKARAVMASASVSVGGAGLVRDTVLNAVRNAWAVEAEAEEKVAVALKEAGLEKSAPARKALRKAKEDAEEALESVEEVLERVSEILAFGETVKTEAQAAADAKTEKEAARAVQRAEKSARKAEDALRKARETTEELKKKWLTALPAPLLPSPLPAPSAPAAASPAPSPTH